MAEIGSAFLTITADTRGLGRSINSSAGGTMRSSGKSLGAVFGKAFLLGGSVIAAAGVGSFLKGSIDEAREAQKVGALTENVIKTTGGAAKISAVQVGNLATAISNKTGIDDEAIQSGSNLLLTFTKVANAGKGQAAIFDRATKAAVDLSASGFGDINGASKQLGKALQDPVKGITALGRSGVTFTDQQKDTIKKLVESNQILGAQKIVLKEVEKQVKGSAAAQATAGEKATVAFGNLKEQIGTALLPTIDKVANIFTTKVVPAVSLFVTQIQTGEGAGGKFVSVLTQIGSAVSSTFGFIRENIAPIGTFVGIIGTAVAISKAYTAVQLLLNIALTANPIGIVVVAFAALAAGLVLAYKKSDTFRGVVDAIFGGLKKVTKVLFANKQAFLVLLGPIGVIAAAFITAYKKSDTFRAGVDKVISVVKSIPDAFTVAKQAVIDFTAKVKDKVAKVVSFFQNLPTNITTALGDLKELLVSAGKDIVAGLIKGIGSKIGALKDKVGSLAGTVKGGISSALGIHSPSKVTTILGQYIGDGLAIGILSREKKITKAIGKVLDKAKEKIETRISDFTALSDSIGTNFAGSLFSGFDTAGDFLTNLTSVKGNLTALMGAFTTLKGYGLSGKFLAQLFADGGAPLILDLAKDKGQAAAAGSLFGDIQSLSSGLGNAVATNTPDIGGGATLADIRAVLQQTNKLLAKVPDETGKKINSAATAGKGRGNKGKGK